MSGNKYDLSVVTKKGVGDGGVTHGDTLLGFAEAVVGEDGGALDHYRQVVLDKLGQKGLVDSAAVVATFNMMDRIADSTGIPLDGMLDVMTVDMRAEIGVDRFASAVNTPRPGIPKRILSRILKPIAPFGMKIFLALQGRSEGS